MLHQDHIKLKGLSFSLLLFEKFQTLKFKALESHAVLLKKQSSRQHMLVNKFKIIFAHFVLCCLYSTAHRTLNMHVLIEVSG